MGIITDIGTAVGTDIKSLADNNKLANIASFTASGFTKDVKKNDRLLETDIPNVMIDKASEPVFIDGKLVERTANLLTYGWSAQASTSLSGTKRVTVTATDSSGAASGIAVEVVDTIVGNYYLFEATGHNGTSGKNSVIIDGVWTGNSTIDGNKYFIWFKATSSSTSIKLVCDGGVSGNDNSVYTDISFRGVKQITLPEAPFATGTADELLDDKINGLNTQMAHSKGDIVVTGNELVSNCTYRASGRLTGSTYSDGDTTVIIDNDQTTTPTNGYFQLDIPSMTVGVKYILSVSSDIDNNSDIYVKSNTTQYSISRNTNGNFIQEYLCESSTINYISLYSDVDAPVTFNISVKLADTKYQATRDSVDMYDYDGVGTAFNLSLRPIVKVDDLVYTNAVNGSGYYRIASSGNTNWSGTTAYTFNGWEYLGTASTMSLQNPYFKTIDRVTRQDRFFIDEQGNYRSYKGLSLLDKSATMDDIATADGFIKIRDGEYECTNLLCTDGVYSGKIVELMRTANRLNAGAYHPFYNSLGCNLIRTTAENDFRDWNISSTYKLYSVYDSFSATKIFYNGFIGYNNVSSLTATTGSGSSYTTSGNSGRPDSKFYDKIYLSGQGGVIYLPTNTKPKSKSDILIDGMNSLVNGDAKDAVVDCGVEMSKIHHRGGNSIYYNPATTIEIYIPYNSAHINFNSGDNITITIPSLGAVMSGIVKYIYIQPDGPNDKLLLEQSSVIIRTGSVPLGYTVDENIIITKNSTIVTQGSQTHIDIIGSPSNYPADLLAHLSAGNSIDANALLVGQDGTDYTSGTPNSIVFSKKIVGTYTYPYLSISNGVYNSENVVLMDGSNSRLGYPVSGYVVLTTYQAQNKALIQSSPLPVVQVLPKVIATNSHSLYKGGLLTNSITCDVATGNGNNGLESVVLENGELRKLYTLTVNNADSTLDSLGIMIGDLIYVPNANLNIRNDIYSPIKGYIYEVVSNTHYVMNFFPFEQDISSIRSDIVNMPTHSTLSLDNSNSIACKAFGSLAMLDNQYVVQVNGEEMVWDYSKDSSLEAIQITSANQTLDGIAGNYYKIDGSVTGALSGKVVCAVNPFVADFNDIQWTVLSNGDVVFSNGYTYMKIWDGNGFGEDGTFSQLTNGTDTDLNGNIVKTFSGYIPTGYFKEEV